MLSRVALLFASLLSSAAAGQVCTGLCLQQVSCSGGATTTISGTIYAPNGTDPIPGALVYIPNAPVAAFTPGVSCSTAGQIPSGTPLVGTSTAVDGTFTLANVPVGTNIPIVVQSGRWRRQLTVPTTSACVNTSFSTRLPRNQSEGDIPKIAVVTGSADAVECVLRKVGIDDAEFTDPSGKGRINVFYSNGAKVDATTPRVDTLGTTTPLNSYDVLMLPCEGSPIAKTPQQLQSFVQYANAGGRIYASHYSYTWLYNNPPFNTVVQWAPDQGDLPDGTATIDTSFAKGQTLSQWLTVVGASTTPGQIPISTLRKDFNQLNAPTQSWLTLNSTLYRNPVMQFTFDTPVGATTGNGCGRVLYDEYHVENQGGTTTISFPNECRNGVLTPQEKLLEFNLFDLTSDGTAPTLTPSSHDFGSLLLGASTGPQAFVWKNNTPFPVVVSAATVTSDFHVTSNTCSTVAPGASCEIDVTFAPGALGPETGTLNVVANTGTLSAALTGTGITPLKLSAGSLDFGKVDVGASSTQTLTVSNVATTPVTLPSVAVTGDYTAQSGCGTTLAPQSSCSITIAFRPGSTGVRPGTISLSAPSASAPLVASTLTGTGVDFSLALSPNTGSTIAGHTVSTSAVLSPIAGFANPVSLSCTTTAPASTCKIGAVVPGSSGNPTYQVSIETTSPYIGQVGMGRGWFACLLAAGTALLLGRKRLRLSRSMVRLGVLALGFVLAGTALTGCGNAGEHINLVYTNAGAYAYTVTATDGTLTHSATYTLNVALR